MSGWLRLRLCVVGGLVVWVEVGCTEGGRYEVGEMVWKFEWGCVAEVREGATRTTKGQERQCGGQEGKVR